MKKSRNILEARAAFVLSIMSSYLSSLERILTKLLLLSNCSNHHFLMEGSSDYLAVSYQIQKGSIPASELTRRKTKTSKVSVL
jgi:hypothetical protein